MNALCRQIRQRAAEEGVEQTRQMLDQTPEAAEHVASCAGCQRALDALADLDLALAALEPVDAPDATVAALLARVSEETVQQGDGATETAARSGALAGLKKMLAPLRGWTSHGWLAAPAVRRSLAMAAVAVFAVSLAWFAPSLRQAPESHLAVEQSADARTAPAGAFEVGDAAEVDAVAAPESELRSRLETIGGLANGDRAQPSRETQGRFTPELKASEKREEVDRKRKVLAQSLSDLRVKRDQLAVPATPGPPAEASELRRNVPEPPPPPPYVPPPMSDLPRAPARQDFSESGRKQLDALEVGADAVGTKKEAQQQAGARADNRASQTPGAADRSEPESLEEQITITAESPLLDASKITKGTTISEVELEKVPTARDPWAIVTRTPGVLSDRINVGGDEPGQQAVFVAPGTSAEEHSFAVDGVNITDMEAVGASPTYYDFDAFRDMQISGAADDGAGDGLEKKAALIAQSRAAAGAFLAERERVDRLRFRPATGYWANTYLPGDPARRMLEASLAQRGLDELGAYAEQSLTLHEASRQPARPFDPPRSAALALYADLDRHGTAGPARTLVQVALRATDRHSGHRTPLALAIVLDLTADLSKADVDRMRTLLEAMLVTVERGDRVHVLFAGRDVPMLSPGSFRHGAVMVAFEEALAAPRVSTGHDLPSRVNAAQMLLAEAAAPEGRSEGKARSGDAATGDSAALGAAGVVIVSASASLPRRLEEANHQSAMVGVPVSVVALGTEIDRERYAQMALAGQGSLRHLIAPADARELVDRELTSIGRVVARALRLNIRLAPGVQLVDVVGSSRLGRAATARARAAEQQIDQMAQRDLGIRADRGEDDDGIQILIPSFLAGDTHIVLLDVVASGPGKVADVSVRYKDLVRSKNGSAQARVKLSRDSRTPAQAEQRIRSVRKSLLAENLHTMLAQAADALAAGRVDEARQRLFGLQSLLAGLAEVDPGWASDRDLANDRNVIGQYVAVLEAGAAADAPARLLIADSLRVAADRKMLHLDDLRLDDP